LKQIVGELLADDDVGGDAAVEEIVGKAPITAATAAGRVGRLARTAVPSWRWVPAPRPRRHGQEQTEDQDSR